MMMVIRKHLVMGGVALLLGSGILAAGAGNGIIATGTEVAVKKVATTHKVIALTFDDGPSAATTPELLAALKAKQVRATFFVLGTSIEKAPALLAAISAAGHEIANHSYTHRFSNKLGREELIQELNRTAELIGRVTAKPVLFRPPGGGYNDRLVRDLKEYGYTTVLWSIDPRDWDHRSCRQIVDMVLNKAEPGAIVLLHEGRAAAATTAAAMEIIDNLRAQGYEFVTVSELLRYRGEQ